MAENPKLIVLSEQLRGQTFELTEDEYVVGRSDKSDITIADPTMSNSHCVLRRSDSDGQGGYVVIDQNSTNGTRVNGVLVDSQELANSDILQLGSVEVLYDSPGQTVKTHTSTMTGINLNETAGDTALTEMTNFSPFGSSDKEGGSTKTNKLVKTLIIGLIGLLGCGILSTLVWLVMSWG